MRWTGPRAADLRPNGYELVAPVPPERWPYGPPSHHEAGCSLHREGLFCDCAASDASDEEWGGRQLQRTPEATPMSSNPAALEDALRPLVARLVAEELAKRAAPPSPDEYLRTRDAARLASVTARTLRAWITDGRLTRYGTVREIRIRRSELEALLAERGRAPRNANASPEALADRDFR